MARKCFSVNVHLQLHAITCPGVWLCPSGDAALRITALGSALESHRVSPIFPLLLHDEFTFKKTFTRLAALTELQRCLEEQCLHAELIQWLCPSNQPVLLATFEASLADVLYPTTRCGRLLTGLDVDLLMEPSKYFPGILAPKIEISTRTTIEEVTTRCDAISHRAHVFNPKTIDSKVTLVDCSLRSTKAISPPTPFSGNPARLNGSRSKESSDRDVSATAVGNVATPRGIETTRATFTLAEAMRLRAPRRVAIQRGTDSNVRATISGRGRRIDDFPPSARVCTSSTAATSVRNTGVTFLANASTSLPTTYQGIRRILSTTHDALVDFARRPTGRSRTRSVASRNQPETLSLSLSLSLYIYIYIYIFLASLITPPAANKT